jgi:hypothetical protein
VEVREEMQMDEARMVDDVHKAGHRHKAEEASVVLDKTYRQRSWEVAVEGPVPAWALSRAQVDGDHQIPHSY